MLGRQSLSAMLLAWCAIIVRFLYAQSKVLAPVLPAKDPSLIIPGQYIIVLGANPRGVDQGTELMLAEHHHTWLTSLLGMMADEDSKIEHTFNIEGLQGYTGKFSDKVIKEIRKRPEVKYLEPDQIVYALDMVNGQSRRGTLKQLLRRKRAPRERPMLQKRERTELARNLLKQTNAPWGLSRVSHGRMPIDLRNYTYPRSAGRGVDVYVIDTGVNTHHVDFEGRAHWGTTIPMNDQDVDGNGHGTHCAATIAGRRFGIAKKANIIAVKVLRMNGFGTNADVIKGIEWAAKTALKRRAMGRRSVANMSLGGGRSITLEDAVDRAVTSGLHFSVAAGNDNEDACEYSPAAAEGPITVGASTILDQMAFFSNYGPCIDIFAPGMDITSAWIGSRDAINTISGTSMASPHVAGVLALYLAERDYSPKALKKILIENANPNMLEGLPRDTSNALLSTRKLLRKRRVAE